MLVNILPLKKRVRDYKVVHEFEKIGIRTILLNVRKFDDENLIIIAMEDISAKEALEQKLEKYTKMLELKVDERTKELSLKIKELEESNKTMVGRELKMVELKKEIEKLKNPTKNGNGNGDDDLFNGHRA